MLARPHITRHDVLGRTDAETTYTRLALPPDAFARLDSLMRATARPVAVASQLQPTLTGGPEAACSETARADAAFAAPTTHAGAIERLIAQNTRALGHRAATRR